MSQSNVVGIQKRRPLETSLSFLLLFVNEPTFPPFFITRSLFLSSHPDATRCVAIFFHFDYYFNAIYFDAVDRGRWWTIIEKFCLIEKFINILLPISLQISRCWVCLFSIYLDRRHDDDTRRNTRYCYLFVTNILVKNSQLLRRNCTFFLLRYLGGQTISLKGILTRTLRKDSNKYSLCFFLSFVR